MGTALIASELGSRDELLLAALLAISASATVATHDRAGAVIAERLPRGPGLTTRQRGDWSRWRAASPARDGGESARYRRRSRDRGARGIAGDVQTLHLLYLVSIATPADGSEARNNWRGADPHAQRARVLGTPDATERGDVRPGARREATRRLCGTSMRTRW
jgi:hypothetical protein